MDELVRWLGEQLDEDAARAEVAAEHGAYWSAQSLQSGRRPPRHYVGASSEAGVARSDAEILAGDSAVVLHAAVHDPARVLREIDAKREIVEECQALSLSDSGTVGYAGDRLLRLLAAPYADRPGYRQEWAP